MEQIKTIGILGGMGPEATAEFYKRILKQCQVEHNAVQDKDYPQIVIYSMAPKGSDESGIANRKLLLTEFIDGIIRLTVSGCDFVVLPCNTAHTFLQELRKHIKIPVISMTDKTVEAVARTGGVKTVGLLASEDSYHEEVYAKALKKVGVRLVEPSATDKERITQIILHVMGGRIDKKDKEALISIIRKMEAAGAEAVILGCTELPLVLKAGDSPVKVYDTLDILTETALKEAYPD